LERIEDGESEKSPGVTEWKKELWKARENACRAMEKELNHETVL